MKKLIISILLYLSYCSIIFSQSYYLPEPQTPYTGEFTAKRIKAKEITLKEFDSKGEDITECNGNKIIITTSDNNLIDTIDIKSCIQVTDLREYDEMGKLISIKDLNGERSISFEYDVEGRILSVFEIKNYFDHEYIKRTIYNYSEHQITYYSNINGEIKESICDIEFTTTGYITKENDETTEYIFDDENRLIQAGEKEYSYFDKGYIVTDYMTKSEYHLDEYGYLLIKKVFFYNKSISDWEFTKKTEYTYIFDSTNNPTEIVQLLPLITMTVDGIALDLFQNSKIQIYSLDGKVVISKSLSMGSHIIRLGKGTFIVEIDNYKLKIVI